MLHMTLFENPALYFPKDRQTEREVGRGREKETERKKQKQRQMDVWEPWGKDNILQMAEAKAGSAMSRVFQGRIHSGRDQKAR